MKSRGLSLEKCIFFMTDNCIFMLGKQVGFVVKMKEHMPNLNETIGRCACHIVNLITKSVALSLPMLQDLVKKVKLLHKKVKKNPIIVGAESSKTRLRHEHRVCTDPHQFCERQQHQVQIRVRGGLLFIALFWSLVTFCLIWAGTCVQQTVFFPGAYCC